MFACTLSGRILKKKHHTYPNDEPHNARVGVRGSDYYNLETSKPLEHRPIPYMSH